MSDAPDITNSIVANAPPEKDDIVISVRGLKKSFVNAEGERSVVLDSITFDVHKGETIVIMGGSGCGKSTLLNCMIGELPIDRGSVQYRISTINDPVDICQVPNDTLDAVRKRFGILFQSGALFNSMTLAENVALPLREHSRLDERIIDIMVALKLQQVKMLPHRDKFPSQLSGGQKKRGGLARAIALDPEMLFYDEPSAGLDPVTSTAIDQLIMDLSDKLNVTSVVVTHEMDSAFRIADRMILLDKGMVLKMGNRASFEALRDADPNSLTNPSDRLMNQFLNGFGEGPLTDAEGISEFERLIVAP